MGRLFWKIFFGFWLTLILTGTIVGGLVWQHNKKLIEQLEILIKNPRADFGINIVAKLLRKEGSSALKNLIKRRPVPVLIVDDNGSELFGRQVSDIMLRKAREALKTPQQHSIQQVTTPEGEHFLLFMPSHRNHPSLRQQNNLPQYPPLFPLMIFFISSLCFIGGLAWYITQPIRLLREATNRFASGKLDTRVMPNIGQRRDEITDLAKDFDYMAEQVQQLVDVQKRLLNDVSHELRSPLARLQLAVEMSQQYPEKTDQLLQRIEKESQRLDVLIGELLTLSRLEAGVNNNITDYFDINGLIESIANDARFEAKSQNKQVIFHNNSEVLIYGSIELLRRAFDNVIRNAIFHTPKTTQVTITLTNENNHIKVSIFDCGIGVTEDELVQLFLPFVRINDNKQNIKTPGYGLGLAIARRAIETHQGSISAHNHKQGGLCITIRLPCKIAI
ncbi:MAG: HAMP domain-containing protein [Methylomarinum sp.]|nr:HAMP domain-containing protein [Methylomarinum sp.]